LPVETPPGGPLAVELVPAPDPWAVARKLAHLPLLFFLDSAERHPERGRYSYVGAAPMSAGWAPANSRRRFGAWPAKTEGTFGLGHTPWLTGSPALSGLPPFQGGLVAQFGYGLGRTLESRVPENRSDEFAVTLLGHGIYDRVISFDHEAGRAWAVSSGHRNVKAEEQLAKLLACLRRPAQTLDMPKVRNPLVEADLCPQFPLPGFPGVTSNFDRAGYEAAVRRAVEYVHAGDVFQVNLSQRLLAPLREHPLELYGRLRELNPAPFGGYFDLGEFQILSASPERFLRVHAGGQVETRPIKGTRPRGRTPEDDAAQIRDLTTNPKDRAENVMIVDLLRNDIGKVCAFGSVSVPRVCELETFRFVHHLVSEVRGQLREGVGPLDLLA
ncbi:MAG: anthranilate synthase component I family protein, partial [Gemmataceae bacterium]|nr:anthranilate synthase component I family protein [Gemmataceae bacterium]